MNVLSGNVDQVDIVCLSNIEDWVTSKVHKSSHTYVERQWSQLFICSMVYWVRISVDFCDISMAR
jgi:hypothetical protein